MIAHTRRSRIRRSIQRMPMQTALVFLLGVLAPLMAANEVQRDATDASTQTRQEGSERFDSQYHAILGVLREVADAASPAGSAGEPSMAAASIAIGFEPITAYAIDAVCPTGRPSTVRHDRKAICLHLSKLLTDDSSRIPDASYGHLIASVYADDQPSALRRSEWKALVNQFLEDMDVQLEEDPDHFLAGYAGFINTVIVQGEVAAMMEWLANAENPNNESSTPPIQ